MLSERDRADDTLSAYCWELSSGLCLAVFGRASVRSSRAEVAPKRLFVGNPVAAPIYFSTVTLIVSTATLIMSTAIVN